MTLERLIEGGEPQSTWRHLWNGIFEARGVEFALHVCRIVEGGQLRIYIFKGDEFLSYIFDPHHDASCVADSEVESAYVNELIFSAKTAISENEHEMY
jgi:hypothetical protein